MSRRRGAAFLTFVTVTVVAVGLLVGGGFWLANYLGTAFTPELRPGCTATVGTSSYTLAPDQTQNAALISAVSLQRGMPARAASIALATALQESKLRNIDYGDLDSVGLFQQRPSQDWGTAEQIMDPVYSSTAFFKALEQVPDYVNLPLNDAAQIVQRSAYPHAYAQHEPTAKAFASALTGQSPAALSCTLPPVAAADVPPTSEVLEAAIHATFGPLPVTASTDQGSSSLRVRVSGAAAWAIAQWAVANARSQGITRVSFENNIWDRNANDAGHNVGWKAASAAGATGQNSPNTPNTQESDGFLTISLASAPQ